MRCYVKVLSALLIFAAASVAHAQQDGQGGPGGPPGGGMGGDGGTPDPRQMQQMLDNRIKQALALTDDAWANLQPMIDKVTQLAHETDTGPLMHGRPHHHDDQDNDNNGPVPGEDDDHPKSEVESAVGSLKKVLTDKSSPDDKIQSAMKNVQDAEKKATDDLAQARKTLRAAVNIRQQAVLVAMGVLN